MRSATSVRRCDRALSKLYVQRMPKMVRVSSALQLLRMNDLGVDNAAICHLLA